MPEVDRYRIVFYGHTEASPKLKAKIELYKAMDEQRVVSIGKVRFHEDALPPDQDVKGNTVMNLPLAMLGPVVEMLRCEKPIYYAFHEGRAVLGTAIEPVGTQDVKAESAAPPPVVAKAEPKAEKGEKGEKGPGAPSDGSGTGRGTGTGT